MAGEEDGFGGGRGRGGGVVGEWWGRGGRGPRSRPERHMKGHLHSRTTTFEVLKAGITSSTVLRPTKNAVVDDLAMVVQRRWAGTNSLVPATLSMRKERRWIYTYHEFLPPEFISRAFL